MSTPKADLGTRANIIRLNLTHLIGTPALKPYMHGYFLSLKLYTTARLIANPQSYDEYRDRIISEKIAAKSESRIRARKDQPKVNKALAERLRKADEREDAVSQKKKERREKGGVEEPEDEDAAVFEDKQVRKSARKGLLVDPRFKELWENPDFEVDESSREFGMINPGMASANVSVSCVLEAGPPVTHTKISLTSQAKHKTAVEEEEEESDRESSDLEESEDDDEDDQSDSDGSDDRGERVHPQVLIVYRSKYV